MQNRIVLILVLSLVLNIAIAQKATVFGRILDTDNYPVELATVTIEGQNQGTITNSLGRFELEVPANVDIVLVISCVGFERKIITVRLEEHRQKRVDIVLKPDIKNIEEVRIVDEPTRHSTTQYLNPKFLKQMPGISDPISLVVKSQPGVATNNELSNQYSVRGGNYDENLIYVNGIEIYKPFLVRSGQQEGMSFINSDMIRSISFSSGGFDAKYGDKMSSVLDVEYRRPSKFQTKLDAGLLGGTVLIEGVSENSRFSHLTGIRYKQTKNILGTLDTKGDYQPSFFDFQSMLTYDINENLELSFLAYIADNKFLFKPSIRETTFGLVNNVMRFKVYFEGKELDRFSTYQGSTALRYSQNQQNQYCLSFSSFYSSENETYDILGEYWLNQIDANLGSSTLGDSLGSLAVGAYIDHARNFLDAWVSTVSLSGQHKREKHQFRWGTSIRTDRINDETNEWKLLDSAGYSVPYNSFLDSTTNLFYVRQFKNEVNTLRMSCFVQDTWQFKKDSTHFFLTSGVRAHYFKFTNELIFSPRATFAVRPTWKSDWLFRVSSGVYYQPAFYKELVTYSGTINKKLKSQKSIHYVAGADYNFRLWRRPFKMVIEAYYKDLKNLIPYTVDNVKIIYDGRNHSQGYSYGADFKVSGEFVKGVDSWISLSYLKTFEDIIDDQYINSENSLNTDVPGYIPRPTDQRFLFSMFFQDYWPGNPTIKVHLNTVFNTGLPVGPPNSPRYMATHRLPSYSRVDMGISKELLRSLNEKKVLRYFESMWIGFEVFNVFDVENVISYSWITDVRNRQFGIPNTLTGRLYNLKINIVF